MASRHPRAPDETFGYSTQDGVAGTAVAGETLQLADVATERSGGLKEGW